MPLGSTTLRKLWLKHSSKADGLQFLAEVFASGHWLPAVGALTEAFAKGHGYKP
jgi:hypothetical protein